MMFTMMKYKKELKKYIELKVLLKRFFKETQDVPYRQADCNQEDVFELIKKINKIVNSRPNLFIGE